MCIMKPEILDEHHMSSKADVFLGDINLHHRFWSGKDVRNADIHGKKLGQHAQKRMYNPSKKGTVTYARGMRENDRKSNYRSTVDVAWVSREISTRAISCYMVDARGLEADHGIIRLELDVQPNRLAQSVRYNPSLADKDLLEQLAIEEFSKIKMPKELTPSMVR